MNGPGGHCSRSSSHPYRSHPVSTSISPRSTKAEILQAYAEQTAMLQAGPTWPQVAGKVAATATCVSREIGLAARDLKAAWVQVRAWYDHVVAELSRPIFKV